MIKVTQADRKAAASVAVLAEMRELILAGRADHHAEPWAMHRLAGVKVGLGAAARALEADAQLCDCFARSEGECACGAWSDYKTVPMERAVEIVRAIDPTTVGAEHDAA